MNWLQQLPGTRRCAYGLECEVLRRVPLLLVTSLALPAALALLARVFLSADTSELLARKVAVFDFMMFGLAGFNLMLTGAVSVVCVIIWIMKGPAYVADAYYLPGELASGVHEVGHRP